MCVCVCLCDHGCKKGPLVNYNFDQTFTFKLHACVCLKKKHKKM